MQAEKSAMGSFSSFFNVDVCKCFGLILRKSITKTRTFGLVSLFFFIFLIQIGRWDLTCKSLFPTGSFEYGHGALRMQLLGGCMRSAR